MSNFAWVIVIVLALTVLGTLTLGFITVKYYWGARGTPPLKGEERRRQREEELRLRAKQFEYAKQNPIATRKTDFWDNSKVYKDENTK
jgi:hypothetical protein